MPPNTDFFVNHPTKGPLRDILFHGGAPHPLEGGTFETKYGAYFTTDKSYAENFQKIRSDFDKQNGEKILRIIQKVRIHLEKPQVFDGEIEEEFDRFTQERNPSQDLQSQGFDGQILVFANGQYDVRVNDPQQILLLTP